MGQEMIEFGFSLIGTFPDKKLITIEVHGLPMEIDTDDIHNIEYDDINEIVYFEMDTQTVREYNL